MVAFIEKDRQIKKEQEHDFSEKNAKLAMATKNSYINVEKKRKANSNLVLETKTDAELDRESHMFRHSLLAEPLKEWRRKQAKLARELGDEAIVVEDDPPDPTFANDALGFDDEDGGQAFPMEEQENDYLAFLADEADQAEHVPNADEV